MQELKKLILNVAVVFNINHTCKNIKIKYNRPRNPAVILGVNFEYIFGN